ncbi:MAG: peptidylprolyl isomerase [Chitinophagaceae bacterium]|nr:MAG: peptidylprolyl isomerase [Chitinophagaceae bacterium]
MSIIQNIRDKAAWIVSGAIALALIAFIAQDAFQGGGGGLFAGNTTTLGKVNGKKIEVQPFQERVQMMEEQYRNANYPMNEMMRQQIREGMWNEAVEDIILSKEFDKLGLTISDRELSDMLYGPNPPQQIQQQFTDPQTGIYDANAAAQAIKSLKKGTPQYASFWGEFVPSLEKGRLKEKYYSILGNSAYVPKWLVEKTNADASQTATVSFVNIPYSTIADSTVKISDQDINQFVNEHKESYRQEESRTIEYVSFDAAPNSEDTASIFSQVEALKGDLAGATDIATFLRGAGSETEYFDGYIQGSKIQVVNADTLRSLAEGQVYGPYLDGGNYVVARMVGKRTIPDSVKTRHILIKTVDGRTGPVRSDSAAKKLIDSIVTAINAGASFDTMVVRLSEDEGSKNTGGVYEFASTQFGNLSKEFAETAFYSPAGTKKTVRVENASYSGYHYIEVMSQKNFETAYKIAYLSKPILASDLTRNNAMGLASQFAAESRTRKQFDENAKKSNINKFVAPDIKPLDYTIFGLGDSRELVRWAYEAEAGDVAEQPYMIGDKYVVAAVSGVYKEGVMPAEKARPLVEARIRNIKKSEIIIKKIGTPASLEAVAQANNQLVSKADSVRFGAPTIPNIGPELKVVGMAFNKAVLNKASQPIPGELGVFVIKTENVGSSPVPGFDAAQQQKMLQQQQRAFAARMIPEIIRKSADIKDERHKFF